MRRLLRRLLMIVFAALAGLVIVLYLNRGEIARRQAVHRVREAADFAQAQRELAWFQTPPEREAKLDTLLAAFGRGDDRLDLYVLQFLGQPACDEAVRARFAAELSARPELMPRWAHYWRWNCGREPTVELAEVREHLDLLAGANDRRTPAWRELLDLIALWELTGQGNLAVGLTTENWPQKFRAWQAAAPQEFPEIDRPANPLPM